METVRSHRKPDADRAEAERIANAAAVALQGRLAPDGFWIDRERGSCAYAFPSGTSRKIENLLADANPPEWLRDLDPEYLQVIKDLGNAAVHPNEGRIEQQRALDEAMVLQLRALFVELLDDIYEQLEKRSARLAALREARQVFKRRSLEHEAGNGSAGS